MIIPPLPALSSSLSLAFLLLGVFTVLLISHIMLRRFSTNFKKSKGDKEERREAKENGQVNGKRHSLVAPIRKSTSPPSSEEEETPQGATRNGVQSVFEKFSQVIHASQTPLPRQTGDSTFLEQDTTQGLFGDIKALGFRDVNTLKDIIKNKASGELVDDKTMLMERIIQVCARYSLDVILQSLIWLRCSSSVVFPPAPRTVLNSPTFPSTISGTRFRTRRSRTWEMTTNTVPQMARTTTRLSHGWVPLTRHTRVPSPH